jgi:hypothetical protein
MYAVAALSGDYKSMAYWCNASERRTAYMIGECARQIGEISARKKVGVLPVDFRTGQSSARVDGHTRRSAVRHI